MMIGRQLGEPTPEQYDQLEHQNAAVVQQQQVQSRVSPATLLQNALKALGTAQGDSKLSKLKVDGIIGAGTTKAANYAFATYLNAPNVMSTAYVRQHVNYLQQQVTSYVQAHGGVVPPPWVGSRAKSVMSIPLPTIPLPAASGFNFDQKYIWYGVAGFSVLLILSMAASVARKRRAASVEAKA